MADRLGIGFIGCGEIAVETARGVAASQYARIVAVSDVNEQIARDLGERHGVPSTTSTDALLANPDVDAVYIAVPHDLHAPLAVQALQAGKHVLVEKPIATTLADADAMIAAAGQAGRTLSVAFHAQVYPSLQQVRALIAQGAIGKVTGTRIVCRGHKPASYWSGGYSGRVRTDWRVSKLKSGGGILIMNAVHDLNTMRYLTGLEVVRVYAEYGTFSTPIEVEDLIAMTYRYENGAIGMLEAGSAIVGKDPLGDTNRIYGEAGQIILSEPVRIYPGIDVDGLRAGTWQELPTYAEDDRLLIIEGFAQAVLARQLPPVTAQDGRAVLEVILAAYQSGQEHRAVGLPLS